MCNVHISADVFHMQHAIELCLAFGVVLLFLLSRGTPFGLLFPTPLHTVDRGPLNWEGLASCISLNATSSAFPQRS